MALKTPFPSDAVEYGFEWLRAMLEASLQEGVLNFGGAGTDFAVTPAAAGGLRGDVAPGAALVKGDSGAKELGLTQGLFMAINDAVIANAYTLDAADATLPRLDAVALRIQDSSDLGSGAVSFTLEVLKGVPTSGATLDNRNGAAAVGNDRILLVDHLVPAAATAASSANMRDRRPRARGAFYHLDHDNAADYVTPGTMALIDAGDVYPRVETSGGPVTVTLVARAEAANGGPVFDVWVDGAVSVAGGKNERPVVGNGFTVGTTQVWTLALAAGSHKIGPAFRTASGAPAVYSSGEYLSWTIEERLTPSAQNNATTG